MPTCLLLRQELKAEENALKLSEQGFEVIIEPIFSVEKVDIKYEEKFQLAQALIVTSSNACHVIKESNFSLDKKIFAIGKKTAQELILSGYNNIFYPQNETAQDLKNLIIASEKKSIINKKDLIIYFCSNEITLDFEVELSGLNICKIIAYKIKQHQNFSSNFLQIIEQKKIDFILFYSQRSVENFYLLAKKNNLLDHFYSSKLLCFSKKIADKAREFGFKKLEIYKH